MRQLLSGYKRAMEWISVKKRRLQFGNESHLRHWQDKIKKYEPLKEWTQNIPDSEDAYLIQDMDITISSSSYKAERLGCKFRSRFSSEHLDSEAESRRTPRANEKSFR